MGQSSDMLLLILSFTTLFTGCYGTGSNISKTNWTDAQGHCRKEGKLIPVSNLLTHALYNEMYFWTGYYSRLSEWIKIIGCYEETAVNTLTKTSYEMHFPSAGLCQEVCLASSYSVFGVQLNKCVCLEQIPGQGSRGANECSSSCSGKYPNETSIKFQKDCGGNQTYNLFKSGSEMENNSTFTTKDCLAIQCQNDQRFIEQECNTVLAQICDKTLYTKYKDWQSSSVECKSKHNSYLFGDVDLTDPRQACTLIQGQPQGPSWLGIAKELYISTYTVKDDIEQIKRKPSIAYPKKCLKCNKLDCTFADCDEFNYFVCLPTQGTTSTTPTGTTTTTTQHGTVSTFTIPTGNTTVIMIVVPVTVIIILGSVALLVIVWRRRQTKKTGETKNVQYEPDLTKHSEKSDTNYSLPKNNFVLEKTETYSLVDSTYYAKDEDCRSPYEECYDDDDGYECINENFRENMEEDNNHNAFYSSNEDESDYGIRNISDECQMENPYSHTNTEDYHVAMADNESNTISIIA